MQGFGRRPNDRARRQRDGNRSAAATLSARWQPPYWQLLEDEVWLGGVVPPAAPEPLPDPLQLPLPSLEPLEVPLALPLLLAPPLAAPLLLVEPLLLVPALPELEPVLEPEPAFEPEPLAPPLPLPEEAWGANAAPCRRGCGTTTHQWR